MRSILTKKPKIGIDISCISPPITGIGKYLIEILKSLDTAQFDFYLYAHKPMNLAQYGFNNFTIRSSESAIFRTKGGRFLWSMIALPFLARKDQISLFWGPAHKLPLGLGKHTKKVVTIHDLVWRHAPKTMKWSNYVLDKFSTSLSVKICDSLIAVSKSTKSDLVEEFNIDPDLVFVTELGVREQVCRPDFQTQQSFGYALFVGTLEPRKNLLNLLEAYALLPEGIKESVGLNIVGMNGWGGQDFHRTISNLDLAGYVNFLGYVGADELDILYRNALFLVMPSLYEGFGLPILEAMARGIPVLTSNVSSMPEVCGGNAVLVDPKNILSIRDGLLLIIQDQDLRKELSDKGLDWASKFKWSKTAAKTNSLFANLLN